MDNIYITIYVPRDVALAHRKSTFGALQWPLDDLLLASLSQSAIDWIGAQPDPHITLTKPLPLVRDDIRGVIEASAAEASAAEASAAEAASQEVPDVEGRVVLIRDSQHEGTHVYYMGGLYWFVRIDPYRTIATAPNCMLVQASSAEQLDRIALHNKLTCGYDAGRRLALLGYDRAESDPPPNTVVLWRSATPVKRPEIKTTGPCK